MGFRGVSIGSLLLILAIVVLLFGTKKLGNIGHDLATALKAFRQGLKDDGEAEPTTLLETPASTVTNDIKDDKQHV